MEKHPKVTLHMVSIITCTMVSLKRHTNREETEVDADEKSNFYIVLPFSSRWSY